MPATLRPLEYPDRFEVRLASGTGGIRWNRRWANVWTVCVGESVGLEEIHDGIRNVYVGPLRLGRPRARQMRGEDAYGRLRRRTVSPTSPDSLVTVSTTAHHGDTFSLDYRRFHKRTVAMDGWI
jgi:hypothetical protein